MPQLSIAFQTDKSPAEYIALARQVDEYPFHTVSVYCDAPNHPSYGPLLLMAPHIHRARLGPAAVSPFRIHPMDIAAETALLDALAPGRVYVGLARGAWLERHGINMPPKPLAAMREAVEIIYGLLGGSLEGYQGEYFTIHPQVRPPYPLPASRPALLLGTWGSRLAAYAGQTSDEVKVGGSANPEMVTVIRREIAKGERLAQRSSGSVGVVLGAVTVIDEDRQIARSAARQAVALYLPVVACLDPTVSVDPEQLARVQHLVDAGQPAQAGALISDELLEKFAFAGNPADIIRQAEAAFAAGAARVEFGTPHGIRPDEGVRLLGKRVLPAFRVEQPAS